MRCRFRNLNFWTNVEHGKRERERRKEKRREREKRREEKNNDDVLDNLHTIKQRTIRNVIIFTYLLAMHIPHRMNKLQKLSESMDRVMGELIMGAMQSN